MEHTSLVFHFMYIFLVLTCGCYVLTIVLVASPGLLHLLILSQPRWIALPSGGVFLNL